jgi:hypothetical protein
VYLVSAVILLLNLFFHINFDMNLYHLYGKSDADTGVAHETHHAPVVVPCILVTVKYRLEVQT